MLPTLFPELYYMAIHLKITFQTLIQYNPLFRVHIVAGFLDDLHTDQHEVEFVSFNKILIVKFRYLESFQQC